MVSVGLTILLFTIEGGFVPYTKLQSFRRVLLPHYYFVLLSVREPKSGRKLIFIYNATMF
jgi:hypothetical protein